MHKKQIIKTFLVILFIALSGYAVVLAYRDYQNKTEILTAVLSPVGSGASSRTQVLSVSTGENAVPSAAPTIPFATTIIPDFSVEIVDLPSTIGEGGSAAFTWTISGPPKKINTTAVYFGKTSKPGILTKAVDPDSTPYTTATPDFINGSYDIPLRFIASIIVPQQGTCFARSHALIEGKHYWSAERSFTVTATPATSVKIVEKPGELFAGANAAFTWEVAGPAATAAYTAIVYSATSYPGFLDTAATLQSTPYKTLTTEFSGGSYAVPLRFIGNAVIHEKGTYYIRALALVEGRNIWSGESSFMVK